MHVLPVSVCKRPFAVICGTAPEVFAEFSAGPSPTLEDGMVSSYVN